MAQTTLGHLWLGRVWRVVLPDVCRSKASLDTAGTPFELLGHGLDTVWTPMGRTPLARRALRHAARRWTPLGRLCFGHLWILIGDLLRVVFEAAQSLQTI